MTTSRIFCLLALMLAAPFFGAQQADAARRVALVIGNDDYRDLPVLRKAGADATDFAAVLEDKDFDAVILRKNLTRLDMDLAVSEFLETIAPGDTAVFFYSGHGWSDGSQNYLVGTDVPKTAGGLTLARLSIALRNGANGIIDEMVRRGASLKVVIVDACRDNPFQPDVAGRSVGIGRGLARVEPPNGTFVIFSAGAGQVALDRLSDEDSSRNSVFSRTFLPLVRSDLPLLEVIKTTQEKVYELARQVSHEQEPAYYDQVRGDACLSLSCRTAPAAGEETTGGDGTVDLSVDDEMKFWIAIQNSSSPAEYKAFLDAFPNSSLTRLANIRLDAIEPAFWESVFGSGRQADFERYLEFYPDGRHSDEAKARLAALAESEKAPAEDAGQASADAPRADPVAGEAVAQELPQEETVAALTEVAAEAASPDVDAPGNASLSGRELIVALQEVLERAGCYTSRIDGQWGPRSQRGLESFLKLRKIQAQPEPTAEVLATIEDVDERVCPVVVAPPKPPVRREATTPRQRRQTPVATQPTRRQQIVQPTPRQEPEAPFRQQGGNPRAKCGGVLSPADPNFGAPGDMHIC